MPWERTHSLHRSNWICTNLEFRANSWFIVTVDHNVSGKWFRSEEDRTKLICLPLNSMRSLTSFVWIGRCRRRDVGSPCNYQYTTTSRLAFMDATYSFRSMAGVTRLLKIRTWMIQWKTVSKQFLSLTYIDSPLQTRFFTAFPFQTSKLKRTTANRTNKPISHCSEEDVCSIWATLKERSYCSRSRRLLRVWKVFDRTCVQPFCVHPPISNLSTLTLPYRREGWRRRDL